MLVIRLSRVGTKKKPHFRVVVLEKSAARDGRSVEIIGRYNPVPNPALIEIRRDRVEYWRSRGAQLSATVAHLLRRQGEREAAAPVPSAAAAQPAAEA